MNTEHYSTGKDAEDAGYLKYNNGPHLAIDLLPAKLNDLGDSPTITVRTPTGKRITFAFLKEVGGEDYQCVDVVVERLDHQTPHGSSIQQAAFLAEGPTNAVCKVSDDSPTTVISVSLLECD